MAACIVSCWDVCNESNHPYKGLFLQLFTCVVIGRMVEIGKVDWLSESAVDIGSLFLSSAYHCCVTISRGQAERSAEALCEARN